MDRRAFLLGSASVIALVIAALPPLAPYQRAALAWSICDRCGLAYAIDKLYGVTKHPGLFMCWPCVDPKRKAAMVSGPVPASMGAYGLADWPDWARV